MEQIDGVKIMHDRKCRELKIPELPDFNVDGYRLETRTTYENFGCHWHGHTCQLFRDVITLNGATLAEQYGMIMSRPQQMTRAGYPVKVQWEYEFDDAGRLAHTLVQQGLLRIRDALYGDGTVAMRHLYKAGTKRLYTMLTS